MDLVARRGGVEQPPRPAAMASRRGRRRRESLSSPRRRVHIESGLVSGLGRPRHRSRPQRPAAPQAGWLQRLLVGAILSATFRPSIAAISHTGFQNRYYQELDYTGSRVLEFNETGRFSSYIEVTWSQSVAVDSTGRVWIADRVYHQVLIMEPTTRYVPWPALYSEYAGSRGEAGYMDGSRQKARFDSPMGIAVTLAPDMPLVIYVSDTNNHCLRRIDFATGRTMTLVGQPKVPGLRDGPGIEARLRFPMSLGVDSAGRHLVVLDNGWRVRYVDLSQASEAIADIHTLVDGACRMVSHYTVAASVELRVVGCHQDWYATEAGDTSVDTHKFVLACKGHETTCAPRHHPAIADQNSEHLLMPPASIPGIGFVAPSTAV